MTEEATWYQALYTIGAYSCSVPPVCHLRWSQNDWIYWIKQTGTFLLPTNEQKNQWADLYGYQFPLRPTTHTE